ncbi:serine protease [Elysia marginata]|uniref:Serine protease n=1 Tax=Elysia marginata TaxID=1093978 RepID=A0AAV4HZT0_9GAST|nr:serine protease [Elysia marginata]
MAAIKVLLTLALVATVAHSAARVKRVVGGAPYTPGAYPFHVSLWYMGDNNFYTAGTPDRQHTCGGSLLKANWVLTSAVCFDDNFLPGTGNLSNWKVALGMYNQLDAIDDAQMMTIQELFVLPEYNLTESHGDVALLKLSSSANLTDNMVGTIDINDDSSCPQDGQTCTVIGWGQTSESEPGNGSYVPRAVEVNVQSTADCAAVYTHPDVQALMGPIVIDDGNVCAGVAEGGKDACSGDAGSPLLCHCGANGDVKVSASVTTGFGCARAGYSGVYANVGHYSTWIKSTIANN